MSQQPKAPSDVVLLQRKIKYAKRFQREFENHIRRLEHLLKMAKRLR